MPRPATKARLRRSRLVAAWSRIRDHDPDRDHRRDHDPGGVMIGWLVLTAVVGGLWYAGHCWVWPFAACRKCGGDGRFRSPSGRSWRSCRKCKGTGRRVRAGRRFWTWLSKRKHDAVG